VSDALVLVVEDEPDIRIMTRFMLEQRGYTVEEAATGGQALETLAGQRPDVVLLDIRLPDVEGWEVLRTIRADERLADVPVLIMSAHSSGGTKEQATREGSDGYLVKPFREKELLEAVEALLAR
jgi:CheY-like chemotaxis protein